MVGGMFDFKSMSTGLFRVFVFLLVTAGLYHLAVPRISVSSHRPYWDAILDDLETIWIAQYHFRIREMSVNDEGVPQYGTFAELDDHGLVDRAYVERRKSSYHFSMKLSDDKMTFTVYGSPQSQWEGRPVFKINEWGEIDLVEGVLPDRNSEGVD